MAMIKRTELVGIRKVDATKFAKCSSCDDVVAVNSDDDKCSKCGGEVNFKEDNDE